MDSIDDNEELEYTDAAYHTLAFSKTQKDNAYKITASIMHIGEMTFKAKGREEGCEADDLVPGRKRLYYSNIIYIYIYASYMSIKSSKIYFRSKSLSALWN